MLPELKLLKKATEKLVREDKKLHDLVKNWDMALDVVTDPIMVVDGDCTIKCVNQAMVDTFGKKDKRSLIGKPCHKYLCVDEDAYGEERCTCFTKDRYFYDDCVKKWFDHQSKIIHDKEGNAVGRICVLKDITEYKRIEDALRDKLSTIGRSFNGVCDIPGIEDIIDINILQELQLTFAYICNIACAIVGSNGKNITTPSNCGNFCKLLHTTKSGLQDCCVIRKKHYDKVLETGKMSIGHCDNFPQLLVATIPLYVCNKIVGAVCMGQVGNETIPEGDIRRYAAKIDVDTEKLVEVSKSIVYKSRDEFKTIVTFFQTFCDYISFLGTKNVQQCREISKRLQVEKELVDSKHRFRDVVNFLVDWVWEIDEHDVYTYCSERVEDTLGYSPSEVVGRTPFDFMPADRVDDVYERFTQCVKNREPISELKNWCVTKDGRNVCISTNGVPIFKDDGKYAGYRGSDTLIPNKYAEDRCGKLNKMVDK